MYNSQETEKEILKFWKAQKIFEKLIKKNKGKKKWSFLDGPITANNPMGVHHAWGRTYKDLFHRFKAMQGHEIRYQNGFDCQGLWVEREEEKELGLKNKEDIEKFGILNFVKACKKRVEKFSKIQAEQSIRLGYWMDWNNSYYTMSDDNQLHNWFLIKTYFNKKWLYKGKDVVPWCPRCGTASSKHDIATEGYKEVIHKSLFMQFPIKESSDEYFLIFTTTPWTVPANVAIAVNNNIDYVKVENQGLKYWLAESRLKELNGNYKILEKKKGKELKGIEYIMPYSSLDSQKNSPHKVVTWELASGEEGTGIVHIAPGCGAEDFELGKKEALPAISPLNEAGYFNEGYGEYSMKSYSEVNKKVLEELEQRKFVYKIEFYKHRYPHCWRCGEELVFRLVDEWYVKCGEIKENLINENKKIKWYPEYGKQKQEEWFKNMGDWLISRKRYWGLPLPIWECECGCYDVIGSLEELKQKAIDKKKVDALKEIHKPWIDEIKIKCKKCGRAASRITDVGDAWLDAGITPFSTIGPYLKNKEYWKKWFPADMISENMPGQFRGWFNSLFWASVTLTGKAPFKSLFGYETLKDEKGDEMHKSKGNAIWFDEAVEKVGADSMRLLYCLQDPSLELRFGFNVLKEPINNINILFNMKNLVENCKEIRIKNIEDRWILSRANNLIKTLTKELEEMHPHTAARSLQNFWLNELSRGYIQIIRNRLSSEDKEAKYVLKNVYVSLLKLTAPIVPFITEKIWQELRKLGVVEKESVHLSDWPVSEKKLIDNKLEQEFQLALKIIEKGMAERDSAKIGLKWPLTKAIIKTNEALKNEILEIIKVQLNIKNIEFKKIESFEKPQIQNSQRRTLMRFPSEIGGYSKSSIDKKEVLVELDFQLTPELEAEGYSREISRKIQAARKKAGFVRTDKIKLGLILEPELKDILEAQKEFIKERTNSIEILIGNIDDKEYENKFIEQIKGKEIIILFDKEIENV